MGIFQALAALVALPVRWVVTVQVERRRTAPIWQLKQLLTRIQRILTQVGRIQREVEQDLLPELQRVETQTHELINEVTQRVLPGLTEATHSADLLAHEIKKARHQQAPDGTVTLEALQAIEQGIDYGNKMLRQFYQELAGLRHTRSALTQAVNKANQREQRFAESMRTYAQEQQELGQDAQTVAEEKLVNRAESGLHPDELYELDRLYNEISDHGQQFGAMQDELEQALRRYEAANITVRSTLSEGGAALAQLDQAIGALSSKIGQFDGIELTASDGQQIRTLRISVIHKRN